jgi:hypothetical protein
MAPLYGLVRCRQWVTAPARPPRLSPGSPLLSRAGEPVWPPDAELGPPEQAWTTPDLETALARQALLRILPPGLVTVVRALPHE